MKSLLFSAAATSFLIFSGQLPAAAAGKSAVPRAPTIVKKETGPIGIGPLTLGMSKAEVEALNSGDVYVASRLHRSFNKNSEQIPGVERYVSKLVTPISTTPISLSLVFKDSSLVSISAFARQEDSVITTLAAQVLAKYGEGALSDSSHAKPCERINGETIAAKNGEISRVWERESVGTPTIQTTFKRAHMDTCPANQHVNEAVAITLEFLTIEAIQNAKTAFGKN